MSKVNAKYSATSVEPRAWSKIEATTYAVASVLTIALAYAYCFHLNRVIPFDEIGLHNPIYMYLTTGHMTYPMHGQWNYMVVHPPTHYFVTASLMRLGIPLFAASAVPVFTLTAVLTAIIYVGRFSFNAALGLLLGFFSAFYIWSELYTVRPDLEVTGAWFLGLVCLQAAKNRGWSAWLLGAGSALLVYAACCHYWGIASPVGILVVAGFVVYDLRSHPRLLARSLAAIALGGCIVGVPFLVAFVVPYHLEIFDMVRGVQGTGGPADAFRRHLSSYAAFAQSINFERRWLVSLFTAPALLLRLPAVFVAFPILIIWRDLRVLACAGIWLPLFVLFFSQGKQIGYTGYFTPEIILYSVALLLAVFKGVEHFRDSQFCARVANGRSLSTIASATVVLLTLSQVPATSGKIWSWTRSLDALEVQRAAALEVMGAHARVGTISAGNWYTSGAEFLWNAFNELALANKQQIPIASYIAGIDALAVDNNYWNAAPQFAPVGEWYRDGDLKLRGFVFPDEPYTSHMLNYFVAPNPSSITGFLIKRDVVQRFDESEQGSTALVVLVCQSLRSLPRPTFAVYDNSYAYDATPSPDAAQMNFILIDAAKVDPILETVRASCMLRDLVRGTLTTMTRDELKRHAKALDNPIKFFDLRKLIEPLRTSQLGINRAIPLSDFTLSASRAKLEDSRLLVGSTEPLPWAYVAKLNLKVNCLKGDGWVLVDLHVVRGEIGIGVENRGGDDFIVRRFFPANDAFQSVYIPIESYRDAGKLVVQNSGHNGSSDFEIRSVGIIGHDPDGLAPCRTDE